MGYIDIAIIIYLNNIEFRTLHATRLLFESHAGSGANVGGMTPGMAKSSSLRARHISRIKKIRYDVKDMKKRRKQKNRTLGRLPAPAACSGCARAGFSLASRAISPAAAFLAYSGSRSCPGGPTSGSVAHPAGQLLLPPPGWAGAPPGPGDAPPGRQEPALAGSPRASCARAWQPPTAALLTRPRVQL
jgi:hypothetical protein